MYYDAGQQNITSDGSVLLLWAGIAQSVHVERLVTGWGSGEQLADDNEIFSTFPDRAWEGSVHFPGGKAAGMLR
jgi:hypothetical protein